jgi:hypothetical protein
MTREEGARSAARIYVIYMFGEAKEGTNILGHIHLETVPNKNM